MAKAKRRRSTKPEVAKHPRPAAGRKPHDRRVAKKSSQKGKRQMKGSRIHPLEKRQTKRMIVAERDPQAVKMYEMALKNFSAHEFVKAREAFQKVIDQFPMEGDIVERSRVHLSICQQRTAKSTTGAKTAEDLYNLAIAHLNRREFEEARSGLEKALALEPKGDHILYALATMESLRGQPEEALKYLQRSIQLNPQNRTNASHDPDFEPLAPMAEFQALVHHGLPGGS